MTGSEAGAPRRGGLQELAGRVAVVTGGGSGIGRALVEACAGAGMDVAVADVDEGSAKEAAEAVRARGRRALHAAVDVRDPAALEALAARVDEELGGCHLLCNNAGVLLMGVTWERPPEDWDWVLDVNLKGVANGVRAFVPRMLAAGEPAHIVNTASSNGLFALPRHGIYTASKFAVVGLSESLRMELAEHGIGVTALCPGGVATRILQSGRHRPDARDVFTQDDIDRIMAAGDDANNTMIDPALVAEGVLAAVRADEPYAITHPGSRGTVQRRFDAVLEAYEVARERFPDLP